MKAAIKLACFIIHLPVQSFLQNDIHSNLSCSLKVKDNLVPSSVISLTLHEKKWLYAERITEGEMETWQDKLQSIHLWRQL